jgi:RNA recognition motif-containing protein
MGRKSYVGNLAYSVGEEQLQQAFSACGEVGRVNQIMDPDTGRSKGFGFVEMSSNSEAQQAIQELHGTSLVNREIGANEAKPKERRDNCGGGDRW